MHWENKLPTLRANKPPLRQENKQQDEHAPPPLNPAPQHPVHFENPTPEKSHPNLQMRRLPSLPRTR